MFDLMLRIIKNPIDYLKLLRKHKITFVSRIDEGNGCYSFLFKKDTDVSWQAGQHGIFIIPSVVSKNWRPFSVASSETENIIRISTIIPPTPSEFKSRLFSLTEGEKVLMRGPFGEFHVNEDGKQIVGIAGGVGVTPFRSILHEIYNNYITDTKIHLVYAGKENYFAFHEEFLMFQNHPDITIEFVNTIEEVNEKINEVASTYENSAKYLISGSPGMINSVKGRLQEKGIKNIINDPFKGY